MIEEGKEQTSPPEDPMNKVVFPLDAKQTRWFSEVLANPPKANTALKNLMKRVPQWKRETDISEAFGMLEPDGHLPITTEEMTEAIISKAAEDQEALNAVQEGRRPPSGNPDRRPRRT